MSRLRKLLDIEVPLAHVFEFPRLAELAERLGGAARSQLEAISSIERGGPLPVSLAQHRLWILDRLSDGHTAHNPRGAIRLRGPLDRVALIWALRRIVQRHEALRTCFRLVDGQPMQIVRSEAELVAGALLEERDLRAEPDPDAAAHAVSSAHAAAPFDLARDLPLRAIVLELASDEHVLQVAMHHIASDGWSMGVLLDELSELYDAHRRGAPDPLPALPIQYADYAAWQRRWLASSELDHQIEFWRRTLDGAPTLLDPAGRPAAPGTARRRRRQPPRPARPRARRAARGARPAPRRDAVHDPARAVGGDAGPARRSGRRRDRHARSRAATARRSSR